MNLPDAPIGSLPGFPRDLEKRRCRRTSADEGKSGIRKVELVVGEQGPQRWSVPDRVLFRTVLFRAISGRTRA